MWALFDIKHASCLADGSDFVNTFVVIAPVNNHYNILPLMCCNYNDDGVRSVPQTIVATRHVIVRA